MLAPLPLRPLASPPSQVEGLKGLGPTSARPPVSPAIIPALWCPQISVVHVCGQTLTNRLLEFAETKSGALTLEEFEVKAVEWDAEQVRLQSPSTPPSPRLPSLPPPASLSICSLVAPCPPLLPSLSSHFSGPFSVAMILPHLIGTAQ